MKKVLAALLALFIVILPATGYAAASFALNVSAKEVLRGDEITFSGTASGDVTLKIIRPNKTLFYMDVIESSNGSYSTTITIPDTEDFAPWGVYNVAASSGTSTASKTFSVVEKLGDGGSTDPDPDEPSNPGNGGGTVTPPANTSIPSDAGSAAGSVIQPELSNGSYIFGSGTLASAIANAHGSVTVELPAQASDSGNALNFPAQALKDLKDKNVDLILISGNATIRIPAGSITASAASDAQIRIILNTTLTSDAKNIINGTIQSKPEYVSTGIVISVSIQVITSNGVTEIHNLDKPAEVSIKLTEEQAKKIHSNLAGVYFVNGTDLEYVGGKVKGDTFTFKAKHFSSYTILEYGKSYEDLASGHWAEVAVKSLSAKHIITGVDNQHYAPNRNITRAEFATMMMRAVDWTGNASDEAGTNPFKDVPNGLYYTDAVTRAASLGIVSGYSGAFRPNDTITREEAVVALMRAVKYFDLSASDKAAPVFADAKQISAWATDAVNKAWSAGLMEGDGKLFHPKQQLTRAEVAVMMNRLLP
ncbi:S-layer homology domain-containing protein [Paenibacillus sp. YAF4_2]|uniref:S-layer homology domain-containing protein n=1 Tax=Paenibacillus sp. YAF4_2 TaxID=3233085 RepID=UPI003F9C3441